MKINKSLNLVVDVEDGDAVIHIHHTAISRDVFERYAAILAETHAEIFTKGISFVSGVSIAATLLKNKAIERGIWDTVDGVKNGFMTELRRLCMVSVPAENGWETMPLSAAVARELVSEDAASEADNQIVFFTLICRINTGAARRGIIEGMEGLWNVQATYSTSTEYTDSLPTLTALATTPNVVIPS